MRILLTLAALLVSAAALTAGPIRDRLAARWENRPGVIFPHRGGSCAPAQQYQYPQQYSAPASACPGGVCPLPAASAPQVGRVTRYTTVCEGGRCVLVPVRE